MPAMHWARLAKAESLRLSLIFLKYLHLASAGIYETVATRAQSPNQRTQVGVLATASLLVFVAPLLYFPAMHWPDLPGPEVSGYHSFSLNISILPQPASMKPWQLGPRNRIRRHQLACWQQQAFLSSFRPSDSCQQCIWPDLPGPEVSGYHSFSLNISILPQPASFATVATRAQSPHQRTPVCVLVIASPLVFVYAPLVPASTALGSDFPGPEVSGYYSFSLNISNFASAGLICNRCN